jgi:hypothetical protein
MNAHAKTPLRGILIDPYEKAITEVMTEPYPAWKSLIDVEYIAAVTIGRHSDGCTETVWIDDEGLLNHKKDGPYFSVRGYDQPLAGKGLVLMTDTEGESRSTRMTVEQMELIITWPNVKFVGMVPLPERYEEDPIFGKIFVTGSTAEFEPKEDDK